MDRDLPNPSDPAPRFLLHSGLSRIRRRRAVRPFPEAIETRALLSGFSPTDIEQYYLELLDDARFNPSAYGASLGLDLSGVAPAQPLAMNSLLVQAARLHSQDMIAQGYFAHVTPHGADPGARIAAAGFSANGWAESIETNTEPSSFGGGFSANFAAWDAGYSLSNLIVDQGVPDLGHRMMLLDIGGLDRTMRQVGIGIASQDSTAGSFTYRQTDTTIDLAATTYTGPYLTGVVFNETTGNGTYQPGEGLGGVTISVAGVGTTTTMDAGGYAIPLARGTYTVTASGGGLAAPIVRTIVVANDNVRLDFDANPNGSILDAASAGSVSGQLGTFEAMAAGDTPSSYSARIDWGDGNATFATLSANPDGTFSVQGSNSYVSPGDYAVRVLITHLSDGKTVALNASVVVNSSSYSGPSLPNPSYPGQAGSGQGAGAQGGTGSRTTGNAHGRHHKRHPKPHHPAPHPLHAGTRHPSGRRTARTVLPARRIHRAHVASAPLVATDPLLLPRFS
jgi:hypothetical protein